MERSNAISGSFLQEFSRYKSLLLCQQSTTSSTASLPHPPIPKISSLIHHASSFTASRTINGSDLPSTTMSSSSNSNNNSDKKTSTPTVFYSSKCIQFDVTAASTTAETSTSGMNLQPSFDSPSTTTNKNNNTNNNNNSVRECSH